MHTLLLAHVRNSAWPAWSSNISPPVALHLHIKAAVSGLDAALLHHAEVVAINLAFARVKAAARGHACRADKNHYLFLNEIFNFIYS